MIVVDEYLAVRVLRQVGDRGGQLSQLFVGASPAVVTAIRWPHPEVLQVLDPRPLLDEAAAIAARYGGTGLLIAESLAAGLAYGHQLWFGTEHNRGRLLARAASELGIAVKVATA